MVLEEVHEDGTVTEWHDMQTCICEECFFEYKRN